MKTNDNGTDRDMTADELAAYEIVKTDLAKKAKDRATAETDKAASKQAVLDQLGITADEAALLLG
jgi:hypothetical protein